MKCAALGLLLLVSGLSEAFPKELADATSLIDSIANARAKSLPGGRTLEKSPLRAEIEVLSSAWPGLPPADAAARWMSLVTVWRDASSPSSPSKGKFQSDNFSFLVQNLPGPASWGDLRRLADQSPFKNAVLDSYLKMLTATLENDEKAKWAAFDYLREHHQADALAPALARLSDDPDHILQALEMQLDPLKNLEPSIQIPDLVTLVGVKKTRLFLSRLFASPKVFEINGSRTEELARSMIIEDIGALNHAQWKLVSGIGQTTISLYQAMAKRFLPFQGSAPEEWFKARACYFFSLIAANRLEEADAFLAEEVGNRGGNLFDREVMNSMISAGYAPRLYDFTYSLLQRDSSLPFWSAYLTLAAEIGKTAQARELAKSFAKDPNLDRKQRAQVSDTLQSAFLADGAANEAVTLMRERIAVAKRDPVDDRLVISIAMKIAELGHLLKRDDWLKEGLGEAVAMASKSALTLVESPLIASLSRAGRGAEAQELVLHALNNSWTRFAPNARDSQPVVPKVHLQLVALAGLYDAADRGDDLLTLLDRAPWWGVANLSDIVSVVDFRQVPLGLMAARALVAKGDVARAVDILEVTIRSLPDSDATYELLVHLSGRDAIPFLESVARRNRFQERPLIWKAVVLLRESKFDDAEITIRQAVAIDPSDGEMRKGDRLRAYAVFADILEAQGKRGDADIYRSAVRAIRISEDADIYLRAGLLKRAVALYESALADFADAYCIQSRLAVQLARLGDMKKAEEHYRRAFELMPGSFGRMESHCFGCERAFTGELAETLAESTFRKMIEADPSKPQLQYLLGYLRMEQRRYDEALEHFKKATELDPDYINAWKKILEVGKHLALSVKLRDATALAILRLDPMLGRSHMATISDIKGLWETLEKLQVEFPVETIPSVYPLPASAQALEEIARYQPNQRQSAPNYPGISVPLPGEAVERQQLINQLSKAITRFVVSGSR